MEEKVDASLRSDIERAWLISIGESFIRNQGEKAVSMAKLTDTMVAFVEGYLEANGVTSLDLLRLKVNQSKYCESNIHVSNFEKNSETSSLNVYRRNNVELQYSDFSMREDDVYEDAAEEILDGDFDSFSNELSNLSSTNATTSQKQAKLKENVLLICEGNYDLKSLRNFSIISYVNFNLLQLKNELTMNVDLSGVKSLIMNLNRNWLENSNILNVVRAIDQLVNTIIDKWPLIRIYLISFIDNDDNMKIKGLNSALEQSCDCLGDNVIFANLTRYISILQPNCANLNYALTNPMFIDFIHQLVE